MMFTLALCLMTIWVIDSLKEKIANKTFWYAASVVIAAIFVFFAMKLSLDYGYHAIIVAYLVQRGNVPRSRMYYQSEQFRIR